MSTPSQLTKYANIMDTPQHTPTFYYVNDSDFNAPTNKSRYQAFCELRLRVNHAKTMKTAKFTTGHIYWTGKLSLMILSGSFDLKQKFAKESPEIMVMAKRFAKLHFSAIADHFATIKANDAVKFAVYHRFTKSASPLIMGHARQCYKAAKNASSTFMIDLKLAMPCA